MQRSRLEVAKFAAWFALLSLLLGWLFWSSAAAQVGVSMLAVPVMSAMLASRGFTWKRKLAYASITLGLYVLGSMVAEVTGLLALATEVVNTGATFPPPSVLLYMAYLSAFPFVMLVLFVGRTPSLLWSKNEG